MDSSTEFLDLVFSENLTEYASKKAYDLFSINPYQLFDLLLKEERFTNFFARIELYGNNLARLLGQFPSFQEYDYANMLLGERIRSFTLSLLSERFNDMKSRTAVARIVLSAVKLSDPASLVHFGEKLGALPWILRILFVEGHIKQLSLTHRQHFEQLVSEPRAMEQWTEVVMNLCGECKDHKSGPMRATGQELARFIRTVPCEYCPKMSPDGGPEQDERESMRVRDYALRSNTESNVFEHLLGDHLGEWKIILSQQAMLDLAQLSFQDHFKNVRRKFCQLASGDWAGDGKLLHSAKWKNGRSYRIPVFKAFYATGYFILWQIDTAFDERFGNDYQVIKVWAIGKPKNLDEIGVQIHQAQQMYTKARVEACSRDDLDWSRGTRYPQSVNLGEEEGGSMGDDGRDDEDCHDSTQLAKFYSLTATVLDRVAVPDGRVVVPVVISREEAAVVNYFLGATFILGRSGTGKTTCLVYKLVGRYITAKENGEPLRQVLLTRSERLVEKLRDNTDGLIKTKMGKLGEKIPHQANDSFAENTRKPFLSLTDDDFPLVCTFDYLLRLIENSIREQENRRRYLKIDSSKFTQVIDFERFNIEYWEHLSPKLKRGIPVDLAFLEIMGVIKGSISLATNFEPLSRKEYLEKRWRVAPNFATERERDAVFDIYEWYERAKKKRGDIDQADRMIKVMKAFETFKSSDTKEDRNFEKKIRRVLDEIYVDEVQDQRASEIGMLLRLVGCPWGIHFAGDTAQCISKDALFRFANAKALFYEYFKDSTRSTGGLGLELHSLSHNFRSHKRILRVASLVMELLYKGFPELVDRLPPEIGDIPGPQPTLYIGTNIIDILKFEEEMEIPPESDAANGNSNEFGGLRVILVRDEETRNRLRSELGESSLVLTILQSKGMEFDDVLLYDFLSTSPYNYKLDMLEELLKRRHHTASYQKDHSGHGGGAEDREEREYEWSSGPASGRNLSAYHGSHAEWTKDNIILCSELKNLYVGVTRARNRLWILESNTSTLDPVQSLFNETATLLFPGRYPGPMLEILREQDIGVSEMYKRFSRGNTISASELRELGYQMLDVQDYDEALRRFEAAGDLQGISLATAYITEKTALTNRARGCFKEANLRFIDASESFLKAGRIMKAVQCRKDGGDQKGAVKILANNGAYEDAAWLAAENGLFSETSEIYTKLNKYEIALAAYARGKKFKQMVYYIKKYKTKIDPYCWKQYAQLSYVSKYGQSEGVQDEFEKVALNQTGSLMEQEMVLSRYGLVNKLFDLRRANGDHMRAYEGGVGSGLLEKSIRLLSDEILPKNPNSGQGERLNVACKFLQAEHILATNSWPPTGKGGRIHKVLHPAARGRNPQINSFVKMFVKMWEDISHELNNFFRSGICVNIGKLGDAQTAGLVAILVTRGVRLDNKFRVPFDHIELVIEDLKKISSSHGTISSSAQLYCGIYEILDQPGKGKHIALDWSPFSVNPTQFHPLRPVDIESLRHKILRHILGGIAPSLVSLDGGLRKIWNKKTERKFEPPSNLLKPPFEKLESLARICRVFLESSALIKANGRPNDSLPRNWDWRFWGVALLDQMQFRSPHEHSLEELLNAKSELTTKSGRYRTLYMALIENSMTEHRMKPATQLGVGACVSSLLAQYQTSLFLDYAESWRSAQMKMRNQIYRWYSGLKSASEMIALINRFLFETEAGDFPGRFCDNIHKILGALARAGDTLNFYSASVISLYEELALSLIFLVRPHEFLVPDSWRRLYFNRWENKHRSPSGRERFWYQQYLIKVCLSFCELVINIERTPTKEIALAKRSVTLIVVCLINLGTFFNHRPPGYAQLWWKSQEVFNRNRLNAKGIRNLKADELIGRLAKVFREYNGNDSIILMRDRQLEQTGDSFAGFPLKGTGISVIKLRPAVEKERHLRMQSTDRETRRLNTAHILTAFWKLNGPRVLERMRERRITECNNAAHILTAFWKLNGPRVLERMRERRIRERNNAAHILTVFWKLNGPRFMERMRERRRYLAPQYKNCCLLADMKEDKNWTY